MISRWRWWCWLAAFLIICENVYCRQENDEERALTPGPTISTQRQQSRIHYYGAGILEGQFLALLGGVLGVCQAVPPQSFPILQNSMSYPLLFLTTCVWKIRYLGTFFRALFKQDVPLEWDASLVESERLDVLPGWPFYLLLAVAMALSDVGYSAALVYAYNLVIQAGSTALSVHIVASLALLVIPVASIVISHTALNLYNLASILLGILGVGLMLGAKAISLQVTNVSTGAAEAMAFVAAIAGALSPVFQERLARMERQSGQILPFAMLTSLSIFGTIFGAFVILLGSPLGQAETARATELLRQQQEQQQSSQFDKRYLAAIAGPFVQVILYAGTGRFLQRYSAIFYLINLQASDIWTSIYYRYLMDNNGPANLYNAPLTTDSSRLGEMATLYIGGAAVLLLSILVFNVKKPGVRGEETSHHHNSNNNNNNNDESHHQVPSTPEIP